MRREGSIRQAIVRVIDKPPADEMCSPVYLAFVSYAADPERHPVIAMGVVDILGKGAAGQVVRDTNLICVSSEGAGLDGASLWP